MLPPVLIRPYLGLENKPAVLRGIDSVFFESSNTQSFASDAARTDFRERWLGRYLAHDPKWAYVALTGEGDVAGYLAGSLDDPARSVRFADIGYFKLFGDLTRRFPAHLHVNLSASHRGAGVGTALVAKFATDAANAGAPGVHVVTSRGARNVGFYNRNGFIERGAAGEGAHEAVFFGRSL